MLEGIQGAYAIIDDFLVAGQTIKQHNHILKQVIERATSYNLNLNMQKCKIRQSEVPYIGHLLTSEGLKADPDKVATIRQGSAHSGQWWAAVPSTQYYCPVPNQNGLFCPAQKNMPEIFVNMKIIVAILKFLNKIYVSE